MKKKHLILFMLLIFTLTLTVSGCGSSGEDLDGKYIATFEMNGGTLDLKSFNVSSKINYAYEPGSYILDPANYGNYEISKYGYLFTGWYTTPECDESSKWDFSKDTINEENITLYAGWIKEILYTYSVCYIDGEETITLGTYTVGEGSVFEDYRKYANKRGNDFTPTGYFTDPECTAPWDFSTKHPGGEVDTDIQIYVDYIPGNWILVSNYEELTAAVGRGNIYLTEDIDCGGKDLFFNGTFRYVFEGNGHTVSNFTVNKAGTALIPFCSIFQTLGENSEVRNVNFENVTYKLFDVGSASRVKVASLACDANNCVVSKVSITGKIVTNYQEEFPRLNEAFYDEKSTGEVSDFTAAITVDKQS